MTQKYLNVVLSSDSSSSNGKKPAASDIPDEAALETPAQRKARIRSLYIVHFGMFIFMLGYSIILTGVYPYMEQVKLFFLGAVGLRDVILAWPSVYNWAKRRKRRERGRLLSNRIM